MTGPIITPRNFVFLVVLCNIHTRNGCISKLYPCAMKHHVVCVFNGYCQFIGSQPNMYSF